MGDCEKKHNIQTENHKYSSKIPLQHFVTLLVLSMCFSDNNLNSSSLFKEANVLQAIFIWLLKFRGLFRQAADRAGGLGPTASVNHVGLAGDC